MPQWVRGGSGCWELVGANREGVIFKQKWKKADFRASVEVFTGAEQEEEGEDVAVHDGMMGGIPRLLEGMQVEK